MESPLDFHISFLSNIQRYCPIFSVYLSCRCSRVISPRISDRGSEPQVLVIVIVPSLSWWITGRWGEIWAVILSPVPHTIYNNSCVANSKHGALRCPLPLPELEQGTCLVWWWWDIWFAFCKQYLPQWIQDAINILKWKCSQLISTIKLSHLMSVQLLLSDPL